jgi:hypothetical protein
MKTTHNDRSVNYQGSECETFAKHPFLPNFYACPVGPADGTGVVKIFPFLELEPRLINKNRFNWAGNNEHFSKVSMFELMSKAWLSRSPEFKFKSAKPDSLHH